MLGTHAHPPSSLAEPPMLRVFLADDHDIVRTGLSALIDARPDMRVVGQAATGADTLARLATLAVDVLVLDLSLPDASGLEMIERVRAANARVEIVVLTMYPEDQLALALMQAGASAYLNKSRPSSEVLEAIARVGRGDRYLTDTLTALANEVGGASEAMPHARLSAREYQAFMLLIGGKSVSETACAMEISPSTASTYVAKIKDKLGAESVTEIVRYAHRVGLLG